MLQTTLVKDAKLTESNPQSQVKKVLKSGLINRLVNINDEFNGKLYEEERKVDFMR